MDKMKWMNGQNGADIIECINGWTNERTNGMKWMDEMEWIDGMNEWMKFWSIAR